MQQNESVRLRVGEQFEIKLAGYGAAGYEWQPRVSNPNVAAVSRRPVDPSVRTRLRPGDSVETQFVITALSPGVATVVFEQKRPWQPDVVIDQHSVEVTVVSSTP